jgi:hypothetical protein
MRLRFSAPKNQGSPDLQAPYFPLPWCQLKRASWPSTSIGLACSRGKGRRGRWRFFCSSLPPWRGGKGGNFFFAFGEELWYHAKRVGPPTPLWPYLVPHAPIGSSAPADGGFFALPSRALLHARARGGQGSSERVATRAPGRTRINPPPRRNGF